MSDTMLYVESDSAGVTKRLRDVIQEHANEAIKERNIFKIGLSGTEKIVVVNHRKNITLIMKLTILGGSLVKMLAQALPSLSTDWTKWRFFFCDERIVPFDDEESTFGLYKTTLIGKIPITEDQFIKADPKLDGKF